MKKFVAKVKRQNRLATTSLFGRVPYATEAYSNREARVHFRGLFGIHSDKISVVPLTSKIKRQYGFKRIKLI